MIVINDHVGLGKARNLGVQQSHGDLIAFVDDDAILDPYWVQNVISVFQRFPAIVGATGKILPKQEVPRWFPISLYWILGCDITNKFRSFSLGHGTNMIFRREAFFIGKQQVVFFQDKFTALGKEKHGLVGDDVDFQLRLSGSIVYDPSIVVHHNISTSRITNSYIRHYAFWQGISERRFDLLYGHSGKEKRSFARSYFQSVIDLAKGPRSWFTLLTAYSAGLTGYVYATLFLSRQLQSD